MQQNRQDTLHLLAWPNTPFPWCEALWSENAWHIFWKGCSKFCWFWPCPPLFQESSFNLVMIKAYSNHLSSFTAWQEWKSSQVRQILLWELMTPLNAASRTCGGSPYPGDCSSRNRNPGPQLFSYCGRSRPEFSLGCRLYQRLVARYSFARLVLDFYIFDSCAIKIVSPLPQFFLMIFLIQYDFPPWPQEPWFLVC